MKDSFYPVRKETLDKFVQKIISTVNRSQSVSFIFKPHTGGARAWLKFILNNPRLYKLERDLNITKFVTVEPTECLDDSNSAFLYSLLQSLLVEKTPVYESLSLQNTIILLRNTIDKLLKKNKLVIFLVKLESFPNLNKVLGNLLYSLWKDNKDKISFVTTLSGDGYEKNFSELLGEFSEVLSQNIERIEKISDNDIRHSIKHWEQILKTEFPEKIKALILKYSNGSLYASKLLSMAAIKTPEDEMEKAFQKIISDNFLLSQSDKKLELNQKDDKVFLGKKDISLEFTSQEMNILKALINNKGQIVNRDELAEALWGEESYEKYSDWAIDKFISLIRNKLLKLNFAGYIKTVKGKGLVLSDP